MSMNGEKCMDEFECDSRACASSKLRLHGFELHFNCFAAHLFRESASPDPTVVVGESNEETGTTDENYLIHQFLMTLNRQFESMRHFPFELALGTLLFSRSVDEGGVTCVH
ncbi:hypothetical protein DFJ58DRAFT_844275 [Suillus subalutaceus]|uniref:uncharacterized protein n=1 Tax=Suillus subalutaceus TaxID=48586 RepID=UPI001B876AB7|nr:uncharacterized protein DFJ58DRAFT_844275 [Suillus subalutaceus]KAG1843585.1 hypothetical protein DFJ58DRAFT_844275 [Suillus subalutaceus]